MREYSNQAGQQSQGRAPRTCTAAVQTEMLTPWRLPLLQIVVHGLPYSFSWQDLKGERHSMMCMICCCSDSRAPD